MRKPRETGSRTHDSVSRASSTTVAPRLSGFSRSGRPPRSTLSDWLFFLALGLTVLVILVDGLRREYEIPTHDHRRRRDLRRRRSDLVIRRCRRGRVRRRRAAAGIPDARMVLARHRRPREPTPRRDRHHGVGGVGRRLVGRRSRPVLLRGRDSRRRHRLGTHDRIHATCEQPRRVGGHGLRPGSDDRRRLVDAKQEARGNGCCGV